MFCVIDNTDMLFWTLQSDILAQNKKVLKTIFASSYGVLSNLYAQKNNDQKSCDSTPLSKKKTIKR